MSKELPEPWGSILGPKGIHSYRDLAAVTDVGHETARRLCTGGRTSPDTVNKVADALFEGDRTRVWELHGTDVVDHGDWSLPPGASLLDDDQRDAIRAVVRGMLPVAVKRKELMGNVDHPATNTELGSGPGPAAAAEAKKVLDAIDKTGAIKQTRAPADEKDTARGDVTA